MAKAAKMDTKKLRNKIKQQLDVIQQWRQSGQSIAAWSHAQGVDAKPLMGWVTYEKRWRQRLNAVPWPRIPDPSHAASGWT
jgi:hypothetical protein